MERSLAILTFAGNVAVACSSFPVAPTKTIAPGVHMPSLNLGTCCGSDPTLGVPAWLQAGGVGIDTAYDYNDQPAIAATLAKVGKPRNEIFITTKVPAGVGAIMSKGEPDKDCTLDPDRALSLVKEDLRQLNASYVDLVLLHGPCELQGSKAKIDPAEANAAQWRGLQMALEQGLTRAIGVSNYNKSHLEALLRHPDTKTRPAVNQCQMSINGTAMCFDEVCLHGPGHDDETIAYALANNITYEAYDTMRGCPFHDERVGAIAASRNMSVAQVCTRWTLQRGAVIAAGTGHNASKVALDSADNLGALRPEFELADDDMHYLDNILVWRRKSESSITFV